jgi:UPF0176 protein
MMSKIINTSTYRFIELDDLPRLKEHFLMTLHQNELKGTVLLSSEGLNIIVAGSRASVDALYAFLESDQRFVGLDFKESVSDSPPFQKIIVRIKPEIITMGVEEVQPQNGLAKHIKSKQLQEWFDQGKDFAILDTRNRYETRFGTFKDAIDLNIDTFREFPEEAANQIPLDAKEKPLVMFCTGGVRCEKAAIELENQGFQEVYQLEGGILRYFEECQGKHWEGDCFVFDERIALDKNLRATGATQCKVCAAPVSKEEQEMEAFVEAVSCPYCLSESKRA